MDLSFAYKRIVFINIYVARGAGWGPIGPSSGTRDIVVVVDFARVPRSLGDSRPPIIKISIMLAVAFSPRGTSGSVCFAGSSCLSPGCFYVCVSCLPPSFVPASVVRARSAIYARQSRPRRRLKCNRRKLERRLRKDDEGILDRKSHLET